MKLSDFSVGQRVVIIKHSRTLPVWATDIETWGVVKKVGNRYIHVAIKDFDGWIVQFDSQQNFKQKTMYTADYSLFLDRKNVLEYWTKEWVLHHVRRMFAVSAPLLTHEQILSLASVLNIDPEGWAEEAPPVFKRG